MYLFIKILKLTAFSSNTSFPQYDFFTFTLAVNLVSAPIASNTPQVTRPPLNRKTF